MDDYIYVDKTEFIYNLAKGAKYYFLSRPRRFGKSLLIDTIGEVFLGNKELFKGLWIYDSDYIYERYPVVRLDMSRIANETPGIFKQSLLSYLKLCYEKEGFGFEDNIESDAFAKLILLLYEKYEKRVVVLVDEYDKPILDHIDDIETAIFIRKIIGKFYGILKSMDPYLRFTFFTGVSKFAKTSLFSELNNLTDITLAEEYAGICGIPVGDLDHYFHEYITILKTHKSFRDCGNIKDEILAWYDGYSWDGESRLLNPFSLLSFFASRKLSGYWYASGSPRFLLDLIKKKPESYVTLMNTRISEDMLDSIEIDKITIEPLLFQTGYLTVQEVQHTPDDLLYLLKIPNKEVRRAFNLHVLTALVESDDVQTGRARLEISEALQAGDLQKMLGMLRGLFASIPYELHIDKEAYYHSIFYAVMTVLGFDIEAEVSVSKGRVDAVLELDDKVYIIEFKYERCPPDVDPETKQKLFEKALKEGIDQIKDRCYSKKYMGSGKTIHQVAFAFLGRDDIDMISEIL